MPGKTLPFDAVKEPIAERLKMNVETRALRHFDTVVGRRL
jgi:hypothetical protein